MAVDLDNVAGGPIPGGGPTNREGLTITVPIPTTTVDTAILGGDAILMGWSLHDAFDGGGYAIEWIDGGSAAGVLLGASRAVASVDAQTGTSPQAASASGAAAALAPAIGGGAGLTVYVQSLQITGLGATGASTVTATLTGVQGGTISFPISVPAGVNTPITPIQVVFGGRGLAASGAATAITLNVPSFGAGNTLAEAALQGIYLQTIGASNTEWLGDAGIYVRTGLFLHVIQGGVKGGVWIRQ